MARPRPRPGAVPVRFPLFDYPAWAARLVKEVREGRALEAAIASAEGYAREVRDVECSHEAARLVGQDAGHIRKNCEVPAAVITRWQEEAVRKFAHGTEYTDRKLARFLADMYWEVRAAQVAEAVREAHSQAAEAEKRGDEQDADRWRWVTGNLEAMRQSIGGSGFGPVPHPRGG